MGAFKCYASTLTTKNRGLTGVLGGSTTKKRSAEEIPGLSPTVATLIEIKKQAPEYRSTVNALHDVYIRYKSDNAQGPTKCMYVDYLLL